MVALDEGAGLATIFGSPSRASPLPLNRQLWVSTVGVNCGSGLARDGLRECGFRPAPPFLISPLLSHHRDREILHRAGFGGGWGLLVAGEVFDAVG
jgi:hypothetical protein